MLFSEDRFVQRDASYGSIEVICGSMFSGKTEELIRRMRRAQFAKLDVEIFKPTMDTRYHQTDIISHDSNHIPSTPVDHSSAILLLSSSTRVVGIDEAQFFDDELPNTCNTLANRGIRVIIAGLDMDFKGRPFGPIPALMAIAEHVTKVHAVCMRCGAPANYSYRIAKDKQKLLLGEKESYEPRCRACFYRNNE
ncbi:thymidine kinase [Parapedobacter koreensis]|uniref:Thymidine kinase n=1 Tax=Parapedobacter koreensis TaxID=332977 RepID=A0A1H7NWE5_9SPHI|nr:thymidine kinase [Parapedobacter koreensis]SEL27355.1 thymidine kinase [Parapedobacter koreensis]